MKRGLFYLLASAVTLYAAMLYNSESLLLLFYVELALPAALFIVYFPWMRRLRARLEIPVQVTEEGKRLAVSAACYNPSILPGITVVIKLRLEYTGRREKAAFQGSVPGRGRKRQNNRDGNGYACIQGEFLAGGAGTVRIRIHRIWCLDPIGILAVPLPRKRWEHWEEKILVLPEIIPVPVAVSKKSRDFAGESDTFSDVWGGDDPAEVFQIRNYQPGDKLRSVHWKLSAREQELMVREQALPLACPVLFYLDLQGAGGRKCPWGAFMKIVASISMGMLLEGCRHYVIWYDSGEGDIRRMRVEKEEDLYEMLLQVFQVYTLQKPQDLEELYRKKYHNLEYVTVLWLNLELKLQVNGQEFRSYQGLDLEKELGRQEIMV